MLVSTPTERDIRGAQNRNGEARQINLVPELCTPTGYTDAMRRNFQLMKDVAVHTRVGPADRIRKLIAFNQRLHSTESSIACFNDWSLQLSKNLVTIPDARELPRQTILLGNNRQVKVENADWTREFQGRNSMYKSDLLDRWVVVASRRLEKDVRGFIEVLMQVSDGMRYQVNKPIM